MQKNLTKVLLWSLEIFWCFVSCAAVAGAVALAMSVSGCTSASPLGPAPIEQIHSPAELLRGTARVESRNESILGFGVMTLASYVDLTVTFERPVVAILVRTRHREHIEQFDKPRIDWKYRYEPRLWLERDPGELSALEFIAIDETGRKQNALVAWKQILGLKANIGCNGYSHDRDSVSTCQSRAGLVQEIRFDVPVSADWAAPECEPIAINGREINKRLVSERWHVILPPGICVLRFRDANRNEHRAIMKGYTDAGID